MSQFLLLTKSGDCSGTDGLLGCLGQRPSGFCLSAFSTHASPHFNVAQPVFATQKKREQIPQ